MNSKKNISLYCIIIILLLSLVLIQGAAAVVITDNGNTYLVDQTGERWDITQAVSLGFEPRYFEFGIGRNAFRPLGDSDWSNDTDSNAGNFRVIGIADGDEAQAYSVPKLYYHEIANTESASGPIAAGY